ncbi:MAG: 4Fe-4S dicluster domain-containing protein [Bacteroidota bacterium]
MTINEIQSFGIIGAGGAGFPTHVKLNSNPDTIIMNAAECEPLLHKDMQILRNHGDEVLEGFKIAMQLTGAREGIIGIKDKHHEEIELLESRVSGNCRVQPIDDVYPAGDEVTLIYMTTGRIVPPGALPLSVGCVVQNVETLYNIGANKPVVSKFISVAGAVEEPATVEVPVGTSYAEVLSHFKITADEYVVRSGGLMMGVLEQDLNTVVSKRTSALIVLPADHYCVTMYRRFSTDHAVDIIAKAGCDQCSFCTELCPRYLLGHPVRPELAMRNRMFTREDLPLTNPGNLSCCECNLCTMYACPEGLDPKGATLIDKRLAKSQKTTWSGERPAIHPMFEYRKVPVKKLKQRLDVTMFRDEGPLKQLNIHPNLVRVPLHQHSGTPARPVVKEGDRVKKYEMIGNASSKISCTVHASIDGIVRKITDDEIIIERV